MFSSLTGAQTATMMACQRPSQRMPFSHPAMAMCMSAAASTSPQKADVATSVSLCVLAFVSLFAPITFVHVVVIISLLLLTCLTGLIRLESLVGHESKPATRTARGD